jgi:hypothetical protein
LIYIKGIPRKNILKPSHSKFRLDNQKFSLGDRVVCTTDEGAVPLGAKGTVVGIDEDIIEVLFDIPLVGGTDLDGRCSVFRGKQCSFGGLLNLTDIQPPYSTHSPRTIPEHQPKKVYSGGPPVPNKWARGSPLTENGVSKPSRPVDVQVESMLKQMLHIDPVPTNPIIPFIPQSASVTNQSVYVPGPAPVLYSNTQVSERFLTMLQNKSFVSGGGPLVVPSAPIDGNVEEENGRLGYYDGIQDGNPPRTPSKQGQGSTKSVESKSDSYRGRGGKRRGGRGRGRGGS